MSHVRPDVLPQWAARGEDPQSVYEAHRLIEQNEDIVLLTKCETAEAGILI